MGGPGRQRRMTTDSERAEVVAWFHGRLANEQWPGVAGGEPARVEVDDDEILVVVKLNEPPGPSAEEPNGAVSAGVIDGFRTNTRPLRIAIAEEAGARFGRVVSWGAQCGTSEVLFTTANVPVMTRLRMADRRVLDTLVAAGVARSRSEALSWCVSLVGRHEAEWLADLRRAFEQVEAVRGRGPTSDLG